MKPFQETDAYKLGIIDEKGSVLKKLKDLKTTEEKDAYNYLHRLIFNVKRLINKLPGGESNIKNLVAAFFMFKEAYQEHSTTINEHDLNALKKRLDKGLILVDEQVFVEKFLSEDVANITGAGVSTDQPVIKRRKIYKNNVKSTAERFRKISSFL
jgi:hypothetical protein